ncbi:respiratory nitrate reductase subunit gamma [Methanolobus vulcani]|jgi:heterodisulfide reductase subunit E|uniref:Disulfide reductase n=1 Tax=Methanolobus vulcani TaxID=38026 RepID=A0A7Z8KQU1_9EURY|nr:respiratory nitrate reductase subunit gamma [Methanolobus vulcani]TQD27571.1 disulfide reductase [Methanolobus vulcani]
MDYFAGVTDALRVTFVQMMLISFIAMGIFVVGMYINLKKWGMGSTGYGAAPSKSIMAFPKMLMYQMSEHAHVHNQSVLETFVLDILFQRRILRRSPLRWFMHFTIFVGWMVLFAMSGAMFAVEMIHLIGEKVGYAHDLPWFMIPETFRELLSVPNDVFSYILLIGIIIAIYRRLFVAKVREATIAYDSILLIGLTLITISGFVADGIRTGRLWGLGIDSELAPPMALFHVVISLLFCIAYIPFSKYIHVIAIPLALLANKGGE